MISAKSALTLIAIAVILMTASFSQADSASDILAGNEAAQRGDWNKATSHFTKAIESGSLSKPNLAVAYNNRGSAWDDKGHLDNALKDYTKAIETDPSYHEAYFNRSQAYERKGAIAKALDDAKKAAALSPQDEEYSARVGQIQAKNARRK